MTFILTKIGFIYLSIQIWSNRSYFSFLFYASSMHVVYFDMELYFETVKLLGEFRHDGAVGFSIGGRDASIVAMMKKHNVKMLVTHDTDFRKLADGGIIHVYDPILSAIE
ncbi:MAG: PIN domain-containing protein [Candidatus Eiseniibacteriota bacterium]